MSTDTDIMEETHQLGNIEEEDESRSMLHSETSFLGQSANQSECRFPSLPGSARLSRSKIREQQNCMITEVPVNDSDDEGSDPGCRGDSGEDSEDGSDVFDATLNDEMEEDCDTDLEIDIAELLKQDSPEVDVSGRENYMSTCSEEGVVPVSYFLRKINEREFVMRFHGLGPKGAKAISVPLENNTSIERLDLEGNWIEKEGAMSLAKILSENYYITELVLPENMIGNEGVASLCTMMIDNHRITKLDLSGNGIDDEGADCFHNMLMKNSTLKHLYLRHNRIEDEGARLFSEVLAQNESLETLDLSWNMIRTTGSILLAEGIQENIGLKKFYLSMNGLGLSGAEAMGRALKINRSLLLLDISYCRIPYKGAISLAVGLQTNDILDTLYVGSNPLSADGAYAILTALDKNESSLLTLLDLSNILVKEDFPELHNKIKQTRALEIVHGGVVKAQQPPHDVSLEDPLESFRRDPMTKFKEYIDNAGLRLIDLFKQFDRDQSMTVSREEFIKGIQMTDIDLSLAQLTILADKLDVDSDGEIDYGELVYGDKSHRREKREILKKQIELDNRKQNEPEKEALLQIAKEDRGTNT